MFQDNFPSATIINFNLYKKLYNKNFHYLLLKLLYNLYI